MWDRRASFDARPLYDGRTRIQIVRCASLDVPEHVEPHDVTHKHRPCFPSRACANVDGMRSLPFKPQSGDCPALASRISKPTSDEQKHP